MYESHCECPKDDMAENIQRMQSLAGIQEAKPDFLDLDKDGDREESMKKAASDAKKHSEVKESMLNLSGLWQNYRG